ncbi:MAG: transketolase [bacterium]
MGDDEIQRLVEMARRIRIDIVKMITKAGSGHPGGSLSAVDILTALYFKIMRLDPKNPAWEDRDRFVLSKGHAAPALYATLAERGFFPLDWLETFSADGSRLQKHPDMKLVPGIEISTGALGQGLSVAIGIALDGRLRKKDYRVYAMIGDGESDEGQIWEAAMAAAHFKVDNLIAFLDYNRLQVDGTTFEIMNLEPIEDKWRAFGWNVATIDGHDIGQILSATESAWGVRGKPSMIIAKTVKGKGVSFIENKVEWHANAFSPEEGEVAVKELSGS